MIASDSDSSSEYYPDFRTPMNFEKKMNSDKVYHPSRDEGSLEEARG
jgi:hypothetical protein